MGSWSKIIASAVTLAILFVALCDPAEARRRIRFGAMPSFGSGGYAEKIDKVYDLPDTGTYFHEGKYYDIGNFYTVSDGGARAYPKNPTFVLYNGDRYIKLDESQLAIITEDLGLDPTEAFRKEYAARVPALSGNTSPNAIERRDGESIEAFRDRARAMASARNSAGSPGAAAEDSAPSSGGMGIGGFLFTALVVGIVMAAGIRGMRRRTVVPGASDPDDMRHMSFDERVAPRLRETREQGGFDRQPSPAPMPAAAPAYSPPPMPGVRTFGRRTV